MADGNDEVAGVEQDEIIVCARKGGKCLGSFTYTLRDQKFYKEKGFSKPRNCAPCRVAIKAEIAQRRTQPRKKQDDDRNW